MQDIGYWIKNGSIYGPSGYTGYRINRRRQIIGRKGDTRHWVYRDQIYSAAQGNTGYCIKEDRICGPAPELPWEQRFVTRVQRAKAKRAKLNIGTRPK